MSVFRIQRDITGVNPEHVLSIGNFKIANTTLLSFFILVLLVLFCSMVVRKYKIRPNKSQTLVEILFESMFDFIAQITGSEKYARSLFPLIATLFVYIGLSNLIGIIPGLTSVTIGGVSLFRTPTADFNTTFGLALGCVILTHVVSLRDWGVFGHLGKFFKFKEVYQGFRGGVKSGISALIDFAIGLLDIIGEIAKIVSLSLRLFGNMYAGEILAGLILGAFAFGLPIVWSAMGLLSAVIQALVFGSLVTAYYMLSIKIKESEEGN